MCSFHHWSLKGQSLAAESDRGDLRGDGRVIEVGFGWSSPAAGVENGAVAISSCTSYKCTRKCMAGMSFVWLASVGIGHLTYIK